MDVFQEMLDQSGDKLILDEYVPKNGTYRLIALTEDGYQIERTVDIQYDRKTGEVLGKQDGRYHLICFLDYWSKLVDMNKPVDSKKIIHSNNYLAFAIKKDSIKEGKLTDEITENYYDTLLNPDRKYLKPKAKALYKTVEEELGQVNSELLEKVRKIMREEEIWEGIDFSAKDYVKLFFVFESEEETRSMYEQEGKRYLLPNIYNSNDFNEEDEGRIVGLPNNNMGMNSKKPYLANRTRRVSVPYLLDQQEVLLQAKLFDYLMGLAAKDQINVYVSPEGTGRKIRGYKEGEAADRVSFGYYLRLRKGKELEILQWDTINGYTPKLASPFIYKNIMELKVQEPEKLKYPFGKEYDDLWQVKAIIDSVLFEGKLSTNFFTDAKDIAIKEAVLKRTLLESRTGLFAWFRLGVTEGVKSMLNKVSMELALDAVYRGDIYRARRVLNLRWSLEDYFNGDKGKEIAMNAVRECLKEHMDMKDDWEFSGEEEFCYAVGQLAAYLISLSKANMIRSSLINPLLNSRNHKVLKKELEKLYKKYNYAIVHAARGRVYKILSRIMAYDGQGDIATDFLVSGFTAEILIYEKKEEEEK